MNYQVVYDIQQAWYPGWWIFAIGILCLLIGLGVIFFADTPRLDSIIERSTKQRVIIPFLICVFGSVWIGAGIINRSAFASLRAADRDGSAEIVEGVVEQYVLTSEGHSKETFVVGNRYFAYSDYDSSTGFHQTRARGGPITKGLRVRITHVDGRIVRLEVAKGDARSITTTKFS
jgi:hypothetical protein